VGAVLDQLNLAGSEFEGARIMVRRAVAVEVAEGVDPVQQAGKEGREEGFAKELAAVDEAEVGLEVEDQRLEIGNWRLEIGSRGFSIFDFPFL